ncbi:hypothetical protein [Aneurinibacillus aneurinilyticus]|uniref:hypothetical protein n=1 Tax=Aneurinibacillus aneurinilyticus TaxID=1391 RepID=UPI0023F06686|nr:hypothetical protein [Aneurinibacillus aneurinilyticus]
MNNVQETKINEEVTVLTDDLGLQREYREVRRKANVGEKVRIVKAAYDQFEEGSVYVVRESIRTSLPTIDSNNGETNFLREYEYVVLEPTDIIRYNNERYHLESRKAEVGEKVIVVKVENPCHYVKFGEVVTCIGDRYGDFSVKAEQFYDGRNYDDIQTMSPSEYRVIVPVKSAASALTANVNVKLCEDTTKIIDMLTSLSTKVTELEREVQTLKERQITVNMPEITVNTPVTTEEIAERVQKALEPLIGRPLAKTEDKPKQLTRSDVVAKAQADIIWLQAVTENGRPVYRLPIARLCTAEFIVNREKRTVVVLLRREIRKSEVVSKGIAKCAPEDVFNVDIGKAIALRRALGLTVPSEYTDAPKPEGVAVGDVVSNWEGRRMIAVDEHGKGRPLNSLSVRYIKEQGYKVIDDSYRKEYRKGVRC